MGGSQYARGEALGILSGQIFMCAHMICPEMRLADCAYTILAMQPEPWRAWGVMASDSGSYRNRNRTPAVGGMSGAWTVCHELADMLELLKDRQNIR